jgi:DNA polymerase (family 10)
MRKAVPEGVLDMLSIPRLHPDMVNLLYQELGITSLAELEAAARQDRLSKVKGLGAALQRKILQGLAIRESGQGARHVHRAAELIAAAIETLERSEADIARVVPAGDLRRGCELVRDLAVVAETNRLKGGHRGKRGRALGSSDGCPALWCDPALRDRVAAASATAR